MSSLDVPEQSNWQLAFATFGSPTPRALEWSDPVMTRASCCVNIPFEPLPKERTSFGYGR